MDTDIQEAVRAVNEMPIGGVVSSLIGIFVAGAELRERGESPEVAAFFARAEEIATMCEEGKK